MQHIEMEILITPRSDASIDDVVAALRERGVSTRVEEHQVYAVLDISSLIEFQHQSNLVYSAPGVAGLVYPPRTQEHYVTLDRAARRRPVR